MFSHCNQKFKPKETWFLFNIKGFYDRKLLIGKCPVCKADIVDLQETRRADDLVFSDIKTKEKATKIKEQCRHQIDYSSQDIKQRRCKVSILKGLCWGDNRIARIIKGVKKDEPKKFALRAYAVGIFGKKKLIKEIPLKTC